MNASGKRERGVPERSPSSKISTPPTYSPLGVPGSLSPSGREDTNQRRKVSEGVCSSPLHAVGEDGTHSTCDDNICPLCAHDPAVDSRWVRCVGCCRHFHSMCVMYNWPSWPQGFMCSSACAARAAQSSLGIDRRSCVQPVPKYSSENLMYTPLGDFLTCKARAVCSSSHKVTVAVVSDVERTQVLPPGQGRQWHDRMQDSCCKYRCKSILAFRKIHNSPEFVFFGMYVHEFERHSGSPNAGRVFVECLDSTPLYNCERGSVRQEILTAILHAYLEYTGAQGTPCCVLHACSSVC